MRSSIFAMTTALAVSHVLALASPAPAFAQPPEDFSQLRMRPLAYARAGTVEAGGSAGMMVARDYRNVNLSAAIGWFVLDNVRLSTVFGGSSIQTAGDTASLFTAVVEPSFHLGFDPSLFAFVGFGGGVGYVSELGGGVVLAPRAGIEVLVGERGVLTPSVSYEHMVNRVDSMDTENDALLAALSSLRVNVGYSTIW